MKEYVVNQKLMGTAFTLGIIAGNKAQADLWLQSGINEIRRIESMLSEFLPDSETARINLYAGVRPVRVSSECFGLMERCCKISALTKGDFDITVSPLKRLYRFNNADITFPERLAVKKTLQCIGYQNIILDYNAVSVEFRHPRTKISFAAIGKGYASDMVRKLWHESGVKSGYINASGDLNTLGYKSDGTEWKIGIANPDDKNRMLLYVPVTNSSAATSGDYEQYFTFKGKRYSHNINPHTGIPLTGIKSVTVFSPGAELSDALATAIYVKGTEKGIPFADHLPQTHCIIIDSDNKIHFSENLAYETVGL